MAVSGLLVGLDARADLVDLALGRIHLGLGLRLGELHGALRGGHRRAHPLGLIRLGPELAARIVDRRAHCLALGKRQGGPQGRRIGAGISRDERRQLSLLVHEVLDERLAVSPRRSHELAELLAVELLAGGHACQVLLRAARILLGLVHRAVEVDGGDCRQHRQDDEGDEGCDDAGAGRSGRHECSCGTPLGGLGGSYGPRGRFRPGNRVSSALEGVRVKRARPAGRHFGTPRTVHLRPGTVCGTIVLPNSRITHVPNTASAKKRVRQSASRNARNRWRSGNVKEAINAFHKAAQAGDATSAETELRKVSKLVDRYATTSTMHRNTAARRKSRLAKRLNKLRGTGSGKKA
ncbi:MAG: 30S ribosomal protein S20 [Phycisphaerales bacterium]|nr:30S ribosomal protein S20 [Phycisphaerales bacterium]